MIATPLYPPSIGGPALYAESLAMELENKSHAVAVLSYGHRTASKTKDRSSRACIVSSRLPWGLKHLIYFIKALRLLAKCDIALVFDPFAVGVPLLAACRLLNKAMIVRVEGDYLWESYAERTHSDMTLKDFYESIGKLNLNAKEKLIRNLSQKVFSHADALVFSSDWRLEILKSGYAMDANKTFIIPSPWPDGVSAGQGARNKVILFAGRFIWIKNLVRMINSFLTAAQGQPWRLEIMGDGPEKDFLGKIVAGKDKVTLLPPLPHHELLKKLASVHAFLLPSLSDVSPNVILDCLSQGTPFLMTKESGFYEALKNVGVFFNPLDEKDISNALRFIFDEKNCARYRARLADFRGGFDWREVGEYWINLIARVVQS